MTELVEYTFRSAPMREQRTWTIKDGHLMRRGGESTIDIASVSSAVWGDITYRGTRAAWLHLKTETDAVKLGCTDAGGSPDRRAFLALVRSVGSELDQRNPDLAIRTDGGSAFSMAMFVIGVIGILIFGAIAIAGLLDMVKRGHAFAVIGGSIMAAACFLLAAVHSPWRQYEHLSTANFLKALPAR